MSIKPRKNVMSYSDDRVLNYSVVFLLCALVSTLTSDAVALACFALLVLVVEVLTRWAPGTAAGCTNSCSIQE